MSDERYLTFALGKGRLAKQTLKTFEKIGITCEEMKDPATRKLIFVNDELDGLGQALESAVQCLKPGGRIAVITFHSLEDRIVKQTFARLANPCTCPPKIPVCICGKKPVVRVLGGGGVKPDAEEVERNPRARSAMLRGCEKLEAQA